MTGDRGIWTDVHGQVHRTVRSRQLLDRGQRVLVAVSGGQDSLCLAQLLLDLQPKWDWQLAIAHCDHRWREDSAANARHVGELARQWGLPFFCEVAPKAPNSEAAARHWRYDRLCRIATSERYSAVATGHTQSDRAETLLYNLIRGAGADGLQSLVWKRSLEVEGIDLVRPLLALTRAETGQFCRDRQLPVWEDATNRDRRYARNRIRHELLPYLRDRFHPGAETTIARTAELLRADVECLETLAAEWGDRAVVWGDRPLHPESPTNEERQNFAGHCKIEGDAAPLAQPLSGGIAAFDRRILQSAPLALQRRVVRRVLTAVLPAAPTFDAIEKLVALLDAPNRSRSDPLPGGAIAEVRDRHLVLFAPHSDDLP